MITVSRKERSLWVEGIVDVLVLVYYLPKAWGLMTLNGEEALLSSAMGELIGQTIVYAIVLGIAAAIAAEIVFRKSSEPEISDERDQYFALKSYRTGYYTLIILVVLLIGQAVLQEVLPWADRGLPLSSSALGMAHWLLLSVSCASLLQCAMRLFYYRRGY